MEPAYDSLHLNTSKGRTEFADYPMPTEWEDYPAGTKVAGWLQDYARTFGVTDKYRFNTTVTSVHKDDEGWIIETADGARFEVDGVVVANGHNWDPRWPEPGYPGEFAGEQMHAHDYRSAETFRNKRVLVVGMGNSAMDIAVDASQVAKDVMLSARHGSFIVPEVPVRQARRCHQRRPVGAALAHPPGHCADNAGLRRGQAAGLRPARAELRSVPEPPDDLRHDPAPDHPRRVRPVRGIERFDGFSRCT